MSGLFTWRIDCVVPAGGSSDEFPIGVQAVTQQMSPFLFFFFFFLFFLPLILVVYSSTLLCLLPLGVAQYPVYRFRGLGSRSRGWLLQRDLI